jgi:hypothetical protein
LYDGADTLLETAKMHHGVCIIQNISHFRSYLCIFCTASSGTPTWRESSLGHVAFFSIFVYYEMRQICIDDRQETLDVDRNTCHNYISLLWYQEARIFTSFPRQLEGDSRISKMTGSFNAPTPNKCVHYARFMKHLTRAEADTIFYSLFVTMIVLLIIAAQMYTKSVLRQLPSPSPRFPQLTHLAEQPTPPRSPLPSSTASASTASSSPSSRSLSRLSAASSKPSPHYPSSSVTAKT